VEYLLRCYEYAFYLLEYRRFSVYSLTFLRLFYTESELKFVWMSRSEALTGMPVCQLEYGIVNLNPVSASKETRHYSLLWELYET